MSTGHIVEDAFEVPLRKDHLSDRTRYKGSTDTCPYEYKAEFGTDGTSRLLFIRTVASFDTLADAQLAAKALNEHKGY
jgi:hypothetical protein